MKILPVNFNQNTCSNNSNNGNKSDITFGMKSDEKFDTAFNLLLKELTPKLRNIISEGWEKLKARDDIFKVSGELRRSGSCEFPTNTLAITVSADGFTVKTRPTKNGKKEHYSDIFLDEMIKYLENEKNLMTELKTRQVRKDKNIFTRIISKVEELLW